MEGVFTVWFEVGVWGTITWHVGLQLCNRGLLGPYLRSLLLYLFYHDGEQQYKVCVGDATRSRDRLLHDV
jgi:hypothetical protein